MSYTPIIASGSIGKTRQNRFRKAVPGRVRRTVLDSNMTGGPAEELARGMLSALAQHPVAQLSRDRLDNEFRRPQPGTILMGYPPLLLPRELPRGSQLPAVDIPG